MNDFGNQGHLLERTTPEVLGANATSTSEEHRHRTSGWWPGGGTALKFVGLVFLVIIGIGWALTLLN